MLRVHYSCTSCFFCYLTAPQLTSLGFILIWPGGHWEPFKKVLSHSLAGILRGWTEIHSILNVTPKIMKQFFGVIESEPTITQGKKIMMTSSKCQNFNQFELLSCLYCKSKYVQKRLVHFSVIDSEPIVNWHYKIMMPKKYICLFVVTQPSPC